ncbi:MAG TPA: sugar phosphate isomerase/epimerase [Candidatus Brocadiia bacterium]|nr:sugar phosphate isomerase/epimerase [Candidatus Brocadiia bacterium]
MARRISIGTWAYSIGPYANQPVPFTEVVEKLSALGFDGLELGGFGVHPNPDALKTKEQRAAARNLWESRGMACSGLAADLWGERLITAPDNKSYLATYRKNLAFCQDMGIDVIRVDTTEPPNVLGQVPGEEPAKKVVEYKDALNRVSSTWKQCAKEAAEVGIRVVWEFEPGFAFNKPSDFERVLDAVDEDNFAMLFDTCHANMVTRGSRQVGKKETMEGGVVALAKRLKGKIGRIHLIDSDGTLHHNETSTHPPFGDGELDFDAIVPALVAAGCPDDWWTIDLCFWPDAWEATEKCKRAADALAKKYT